MRTLSKEGSKRVAEDKAEAQKKLADLAAGQAALIKAEKYVKEEKAKLAHMVAMREAKLAQQEAELESQVWLLTQSYSVRFYIIEGFLATQLLTYVMSLG